MLSGNSRFFLVWLSQKNICKFSGFDVQSRRQGFIIYFCVIGVLAGLANFIIKSGI